MAKFEGIQWAEKQMRFGLVGRDYELLPADAKVFAVSRSIHYGLFLAFEGIRFFCRKHADGGLEIVFLNWHMNLERFRKGMAFNLSHDMAHLVPSVEDLETLFVHRFFREPEMRPFFEEMAALGKQGYLRPFTVDEEQSIGVTFPALPGIRAAVSRYYSPDEFGRWKTRALALGFEAVEAGPLVRSSYHAQRMHGGPSAAGQDGPCAT